MKQKDKNACSLLCTNDVFDSLMYFKRLVGGEVCLLQQKYWLWRTFDMMPLNTRNRMSNINKISLIKKKKDILRNVYYIIL